MAGIAPPFQVPKVHISSHFSPPRRAPGAETCINRAATVKFTLSQLLPTIGRRAGNIPASDPDTHFGRLFLTLTKDVTLFVGRRPPEIASEHVQAVNTNDERAAGRP